MKFTLIERSAERYPSGMTKLNGQPLWLYKLVDGVVYRLHPMPAIYND